MDFTSFSEAPDIFHFWTGISVLAGAARRNVFIDQFHFKWTPNFYIVFVGPPGVVTKSTTIRIGTRILRAVPHIKFGPQSMTWQGLMTGLSEALVGQKDPEGNIRKVSCITCTVSELGTFLRPADTELTSFLIDLWDGAEGVWTRHLKNEEYVLENPWINLIGATTPSWLKSNFPDSLIGGGLTARVIFIFADKKRKSVAYPGLEIDRDAYKAKQRTLVSDLKIIAQLQGEFKFTAEAREWGHHWYDTLLDTVPKDREATWQDDFCYRKQTHLHKLAMVLSLAQKNELILELENLQLADKLLQLVEKDMHKVFKSITQPTSSKNMENLLAFLHIFHELPYVKLYRHAMLSMNPKDFQEAVDSAIHAQFLRVEKRGKEVFFVERRRG